MKAILNHGTVHRASFSPNGSSWSADVNPTPSQRTVIVDEGLPANNLIVTKISNLVREVLVVGDVDGGTF